MREIRSLKNRRYPKSRGDLKRRLFFISVISLVAGIGIIFLFKKVVTKTSPSDLTPGKIYTKGLKEKGENIPRGSAETSGPEGSKKDATSNPESFTFYNVLKSKEGDIVPLTGNIQKPVKKEEEEIKTPREEKISEIEKEMDKSIGEKVRKDQFYAVQVAALKNESAANEVISKLRLKGYAPYLVKEEDKRSAGLYKIRVGRFPSIVDAEEVARVLKKDGYATYVIKAD